MSKIDETWKEFLETEPRESDLRDILAKKNKYAGLAAKTLHEKDLLFEKDLTNEDLRYIIEYVEPLQEEAWNMLLEKGPSNEDLQYIIWQVEPLRAEAQKVLDKIKRRDSLLEEILNS